MVNEEELMIKRIQWLGHGSFIITGTPLIYINPWRVVKETTPADLILVGHDHYEHCSPADIQKLRGEDTQVITNQAVAEQIDHCTVLRPWHTLNVGKASIKAVPAYSENALHHPLKAGGLGFIISIDFYDIYYAGDTGKIPEMNNLRPDIAILPIDGNDTLTIDDAVDVVKNMRPRWVFPSNWNTTGNVVGLQEAQEFKDKVGNRAEVILPK